MKVTIGSTGEIQFSLLPLGAVFEYHGLKYMKVDTIKFEESDGEEFVVSKALNLTTLMVVDFSPSTLIPANFIFSPNEIIFK